MVQFIRDLDLGKKVLAIGFMMAAFMAFLGMTTILGIQKQTSQVKMLTETVIKDLLAYEAAMRDLLAAKSRGFELVSMVTVSEDKSNIAAAIKETEKNLDSAVAILSDLIARKQGQEVEKDQIVRDFAAELSVALKANLEIISTDAALGSMMMLSMNKKFEAFEAKIKPQLDTLIMQSQKVADDAIANAQLLTALASVFALVFTLISFVVCWFVARVLAASSRQCVAFAEKVADGDLSHKMSVTSKDEFGTLITELNRMIDNLKARADLATAIASGDLSSCVQVSSANDQLGHALKLMTENLSTTFLKSNSVADQVALGSSQLDQASQQLSSGASEQAASVEQISSLMTEMTSQVSAATENAHQASDWAQKAQKIAEDGQLQIQSTLQAMHDMSDSSKEIAKIIKVIDSIAFQTNLLALNAAVEAARAGEHGRGFSVVAEEVRNLAGRSAKASEEIARMINGALQKTDKGLSSAIETTAAFEKIVDGASKVAGLVSQIVANATQQSLGLNNVSTGIQQITHVTQQNAAAAEETATSAADLSNQVNILKQLLSQYQVSGQ